MNSTQSRRPGPVRRAGALVLAALAPFLGLAVLAGPAAAHGGPGTIEIVSAEALPDGTSVKMVAQLSFSSDGHPAEDATVTVVVERDGEGPPADQAPVTLTASGPEGQYTGVVPVPGPGTWNLRVTSVDPTATATKQVSFVGIASVEEPAGEGSTTSTEPATGASPDSGQSEDGSNGLVGAVVAGAVGGAVAAGIASVVMLRRKAAEAAGPEAAGPDDD